MAAGEPVVLVTGGSGGIGRATVLRFASESYSVVVAYNRGRERAERVAKEALDKGAPRAIVVKVDVTSWESVSRAAGLVEKEFGHLNVLVNNAGVLSTSPIEELGLEEWEHTLRVNLTGAFLATKAFLPLLRRAPWASIVNVASIAGRTGNIVASVAYAASKAGLIGLTRRLAVELAKHGIRVNAVAPSFVETDMVREFLKTPEDRERIKALHPLNTIAKPEDVAEAIFFLADPHRARFITGAVLDINGGRLTC